MYIYNIERNAQTYSTHKMQSSKYTCLLLDKRLH